MLPTNILLSLLAVSSSYVSASPQDRYGADQIALVPSEEAGEEPQSLRTIHQFVGDSLDPGGDDDDKH